MPPKKKDFTKDLKDALQSRMDKADILNDSKKFRYQEALTKLYAHRKLIHCVTDLAEVKIQKSIMKELENVMNGTSPIIVDPPTQKQMEKAQNKVPKQFQYLPGVRTGAWAILITMYRESQKPTYRGFMYKEEIRKKAQPLCDSSMYDNNLQGRTAWSGINTLEEHEYVKRNALSKAGGNFGQARDEFALTEKGYAVAEHLNGLSSGNAAHSADDFSGGGGFLHSNSPGTFGTPGRNFSSAHTTPACSSGAKQVHTLADLQADTWEGDAESNDGLNFPNMPPYTPPSIAKKTPNTTPRTLLIPNFDALARAAAIPGLPIGQLSFGAVMSRPMCTAGCADCDRLSAFLADGSRDLEEFTVSKQRRKHLHDVCTFLNTAEGGSYGLTHESDYVNANSNRRCLTIRKAHAGPTLKRQHQDGLIPVTPPPAKRAKTAPGSSPLRAPTTTPSGSGSARAGGKPVGSNRASAAKDPRLLAAEAAERRRLQALAQSNTCVRSAEKQPKSAEIPKSVVSVDQRGAGGVVGGMLGGMQGILRMSGEKVDDLPPAPLMKPYAGGVVVGIEGGSRDEGREHTLVCLVDDRERSTNKDFHHLYHRLEARIETLPKPQISTQISLSLGAEKSHLPLGDYSWVLRKGTQIHDEETLGGSILLGGVVERKTMQDLVARSFLRDHSKQLRRMEVAAGDMKYLPVLLIEGNPEKANTIRPFDAGPVPVAGTVIQSETEVWSLVCGLLLAAGHVLPIVVPDMERSMAFLAAATHVFSAQLAADPNSALGATTYEHYRHTCHRQMLHLARQPLPPLPPHVETEMLENGLEGCSIRKAGPYTAYTVGGKLRVVSVSGKDLLPLLVDMHMECIADRNGPTGNVTLSGAEAYEAALEVTARLLSLLDASVGPLLEGSGKIRYVLLVDGLLRTLTGAKRKENNAASNAGAATKKLDFLVQCGEQTLWLWVAVLMYVHRWAVILPEGTQSRDLCLNLLAARHRIDTAIPHDPPPPYEVPVAQTSTKPQEHMTLETFELSDDESSSPRKTQGSPGLSECGERRATGISCPVCTLINPVGALKCDVCESELVCVLD